MAKWTKIIGGLVFVCVLVLGLSGCIKKSPEKVVKLMFSKLSEVQSYSLDAEVNLDGKFTDVTSMNLLGQKKPGSIEINVSGNFDSSKDENMVYDVTADIDLKIDGKDDNINGNVRFVDDNFFVKLNNVPDAEGTSFDNLKGTWYKFDLNALTSMAPEQSDEDVDKAKLKKMKKLLKDVDFIDIVKNHGVEDVNGHSTYHYTVKINEDEMEDFFVKSYKIMEEEEMGELELTQLQDNLERWSEIDLDVWIGKSDYLLYKINAGGSMVSIDGTMKVELTAEIDNYNETVEIEAPSDAKEFSLMDLMMPGFEMPTMPETGNMPSASDFEDLQNQFGGSAQFDPTEMQKQMEDLQAQFGQ
ncbi:hypothetical protein HN958_02750 [Candidatus Falkowbacteria bacterium]|jgi:hypothetical protein|nr:hypothetical protein [Candidatus Falkowbacteria bacterium]MBT7007399.1 hypothetical protein [Candidatus Falkowbacteria bacterium]